MATLACIPRFATSTSRAWRRSLASYSTAVFALTLAACGSSGQTTSSVHRTAKTTARSAKPLAVKLAYPPLFSLPAAVQDPVSAALPGRRRRRRGRDRRRPRRRPAPATRSTGLTQHARQFDNSARCRIRSPTRAPPRSVRPCTWSRADDSLDARSAVVSATRAYAAGEVADRSQRRPTCATLVYE